MTGRDIWDAREELKEVDLVNGWRLLAVQAVAFLQGAGWGRRKALAYVAEPTGVPTRVIRKWETETLARYLGSDFVEVALAAARRASGADMKLPAGARGSAIRFATHRFEVESLGDTPAGGQISALKRYLWLGRHSLAKKLPGRPRKWA